MARGTAVATWKKSWKTGVTAAMRPKVTAKPESAPAVATSTGVRRRASRADVLMCLVSQAPPTSATAGPGYQQSRMSYERPTHTSSPTPD